MAESFVNSELIFNATTREFVIYLLLFIELHFMSYVLILQFRKKIEFYASDYEDAIAYRVSFWLCTFSLAASIEAALLLPMSVISNEILLFYPNSSYINWLNGSLIQGLWNLAFLFSNCALFILLPFSYFFTESQGFSHNSQGLRSRIIETFSILGLLGLLIFGVLYILSAIFQYKQIGLESFLTGLSSVWTYYLPFLYSCVSFLGVLLLLVCTPTGFAHLFTVVGRFVCPEYLYPPLEEKKFQKISNPNVILKLEFHQSSNDKLTRVAKKQSFLYPVAMLFLLAFTVLAALMVSQNTLALIFGIKNLPIYSQQLSLGIDSLSALGPVGAVLEIVLILYLWSSSVVGLYALPFFCRLRPKIRATSMTHIIINCAVLLVLSSALPVLARTLGITNFDLLGDFGKIHWLGNFYIVLFYNVGFAAATAYCLGSKIKATAVHDYNFMLLCITALYLRKDSLIMKSRIKRD